MNLKMKYIKVFEDFNDKITVTFKEFKSLMKNSSLDPNDYLIILPNNKTVTFEEYSDNYNHIYLLSDEEHTKSPMVKKSKPTKGFGSESKKRKKRYWEN